jgi:uncharacterized protein
MLIRIKEIGDGGLSLDLPLTPAWLAEQCPDLGALPGPKGVAVRGQLTESEGDVFLRARLGGQLETTCSRCLEPARVAMDVPMAVTFLPRPEHRSHAGPAADVDEDSAEEKDVDVAYYDGDEIDLSAEIRDQLLLAYPITPLCREDCAGLCPVCGGNRNLRPCGCQAERAPAQKPFAAALAKLKL